MDPHPHPLLYFLARMKPTSTNVSSDRQKCGNHKGKDLGCTEDVELFPAKSVKLIHHHVGCIGRGVIMQKDDSVRQHSSAF